MSDSLPKIASSAVLDEAFSYPPLPRPTFFIRTRGSKDLSRFPSFPLEQGSRQSLLDLRGLEVM